LRCVGFDALHLGWQMAEAFFGSGDRPFVEGGEIVQRLLEDSVLYSRACHQLRLKALRT
jgi:hypothetical protein